MTMMIISANVSAIYLGICHCVEVVASSIECHVLFDCYTILEHQ